MNAILSLVLATAVMIITVGVYLHFLRERSAKRARGVMLLQALRMLVKHVQVHRGLLAAEFGGDYDVRESVAFHAESIRRDLVSLTTIDSVFGDDSDWQGITRHWAKLSAKSVSLGIFEVYEQHCKLVASCLAMMLRVAQDYRVTSSSSRPVVPYWHDLLCLGEGLGQLRALGLIVLTAANQRPLKEKCRKKIARTLLDVEAVYRNRVLQQRIGSSECEQIDTFIALVEHYIVGAQSWITSEQYFSRATETIEIVYRNFDEEMQRLVAS